MSEPFISQQRHPLSAIQRATDSLCVVASLYLISVAGRTAANENTLIVGLGMTTCSLLTGEDQ